MNATFKDERGLTLVEILVALTITAISIAMFSYFISGFRDLRISQRNSQAINFARTYIDSVRGFWRDDTLFRFSSLPTNLIPPERFDLSVKVRGDLTNVQEYTYNLSSRTYTPALSTVPMADTFWDVQVILQDSSRSNAQPISLSTRISRPNP